MKLSEDLAWRGLIKDKTFQDNSWLDKPRTFYLGIDASADSLTIGNLAVLMLARRLALSGWKAVMLAGGATSLVGDPGGKAKERDLLPADKIKSNISAISVQIENILSGTEHEVVNNLDWLGDVKLLDFLRDTGKSFSMSELMQREFVTERLGTGISYAEFSYSLLQGYDFWWLNQNKSVELQIGASDQWTNMLSGVSLVRKKAGKEVQAFSMPLVVNKQTGKKFGKSEAGAVWLDESKTSVMDFYQFWINAPDDEVEAFLKIFTVLEKLEIEEIMTSHTSDPSKRSAQRRLADAITVIVHGQAGKEQARMHAEGLTSASVSPSDSAPPSASMSEHVIELPDGITIVEALVKTGLASSNSDARRVKEEGGIYLNSTPFDKDNLNSSELTQNPAVLRRGKKLSNSVLIKLK